MPQLFVNVDRTKAKSLDIPLDSVFGTLQTYLGSSYVNDFNKFGRTYQVRVQAEPAFRINKDDIRRLEVRNRKGEMVPLGTLVKVSDTLGPQVINRYNLYPAASLNGEAAPGFSSGDALSLVEEMATRLLPNSMGYEWTGISYQEQQVGGEAVVIFGLSILLVFLVLSAQYESWTSPLAVILAVPTALWLAAPAPRAMTRGMTPKMKVSAVIKIGRKRSLAAFTAESTILWPCAWRSRAYSTMRMAFLVARPISNTMPI